MKKNDSDELIIANREILSPSPLNLSKKEIYDIISFLKTLDDQ
ncbi:hypothetical protein [Pedobacter hiemivivus]|nr:hypothetical protein [Pedobacter hiemivivus]